MRATDASKNAFKMGCGGWFNPLISPKNPYSDGTGTAGERPNKASKTAVAENCNHLHLSILWDKIDRPPPVSPVPDLAWSRCILRR